MIWWALRWGLTMAALFFASSYFFGMQSTAPARKASAEAALTTRPMPSGVLASEFALRAAPDGHFYADVTVNGTAVRFLVDSGASTILLSAEDAVRLGIRPAPQEYTVIGQTANGRVKLAPATLREIRLGGFTTYNVDAVVSPVPLHVSLLGMSFLNRLESWEARGDRLDLRW